MPTSTFQSLFQALVVSRLDYYLFITPQGSTKHTQYVLWQRRHASLPTYLMRRLQSVLNTAARLIFGLRRVWLHLGCAHQHSLAAHSRAHQVLDHLSYLQSSSRPCIIVSWTIYLCGRPIPSRRNLRSCGTGRLVQPPVHRSTFGGRAFPVAGSQLRNTLPLELTLAPSLEIFRKRRISYLLTQSYPDI